MPNKQVRVIIDTNLWISFLINKELAKLYDLLAPDKIRLIFSQELLDEFVEVVQRPKFKKYFSRQDINLILIAIDEFADFVYVKSKVELCRDEKDNFLLALALDSHADYLFTGDHDLLELKTIGNTSIMQLSTYLK